MKRHELLRESWQAFGLALAPTIVVRDRLAFDVTQLAHRVPERIEVVAERLPAAGAEVADANPPAPQLRLRHGERQHTQREQYGDRIAAVHPTLP